MQKTPKNVRITDRRKNTKNMTLGVEVANRLVIIWIHNN